MVGGEEKKIQLKLFRDVHANDEQCKHSSICLSHGNFNSLTKAPPFLFLSFSSSHIFCQSMLIHPHAIGKLSIEAIKSLFTLVCHPYSFHYRFNITAYRSIDHFPNRCYSHRTLVSSYNSILFNLSFVLLCKY